MSLQGFNQKTWAQHGLNMDFSSKLVAHFRLISDPYSLNLGHGNCNASKQSAGFRGLTCHMCPELQLIGSDLLFDVHFIGPLLGGTRCTGMYLRFSLLGIFFPYLTELLGGVSSSPFTGKPTYPPGTQHRYAMICKMHERGPFIDDLCLKQGDLS